jgi:hypothetical protein
VTALDLITFTTQAIFILIFLLVAVRTVRRPTPAHLDMTVFFGILAFVVTESRLAALLGVTVPEWFNDTLIAGILALPYVLVRLVDDFTRVPQWIKHGAELVLIALAIVLYTLPGRTLPPTAVAAVIGYFAVLSFYAGLMFVRASKRTHGVTKRRMEAISLGAILFGLDVVAAGAGGQEPGISGAILSAMGQVFGRAGIGSLASRLAFLRQAWQASDCVIPRARHSLLPATPTSSAAGRAPHTARRRDRALQDRGHAADGRPKRRPYDIEADSTRGRAEYQRLVSVPTW